MKLIISFSARQDGNCGDIARYIAAPEDRIVHYCDLHAHACAACAYECFTEGCRYRSDGVFALYESMSSYERVVLVVPMYCGNPSSLYFAFSERGQDFFRSEEAYEAVVRRLYVIGVYGSAAEASDFLPCLVKWFASSPYTGRVLGLERHVYGQKLTDALLDVPQIRTLLDDFMA